MSDNTNLHRANKSKEDEFYTRLEDIENELKHYKKEFKIKLFFVIATTLMKAISLNTLL